MQSFDKPPQKKEVEGVFDQAPKGQQNPVHTLVLEGGGAKGISYAGALKEIDLAEFSHVVGSSVGAFVAAMIAAGVPRDKIIARAEEPMKEILEMQAINTYKDKSEGKFFLQAVQLSEPWNYASENRCLKDKMIQTLGEHFKALSNDLEKRIGEEKNEGIKGREDTWEDWSEIIQCLKETSESVETNYTFERHNKLKNLFFNAGMDVGMKDLQVTTTKLHDATRDEKKNVFYTEYLKVFGNDNKEDNDVSIVQAAAASGSFPMVYKGEMINEVLYMDGGIVTNDPVEVAINKLQLTGSGRERILSLRLNKFKKGSFSGRKNSLRDYAGIPYLEFKTMINKLTKGVWFLRMTDRKTYDEHKNKDMKSWYKANRLWEVNLEPVENEKLKKKIITLTMDPGLEMISANREDMEERMRDGWKEWKELSKKEIKKVE